MRKVAKLPELIGFIVGENPKLLRGTLLEVDNEIQRDRSKINASSF